MSRPTEIGSPPAAPPLQFSMRALLIAVTIVAVVAATFAISPELGQVLALIFLAGVVPVSIGTLAFYCRGHRRTFFAGALAGVTSLLMMLLPSALGPDELGETLLIFLFEILAIASCGLAATTTRRFLERRNWHVPPEEPH